MRDFLPILQVRHRGWVGGEKIRNPKSEIRNSAVMTALDVDLVAPEAIAGVRVMPVLHERVDLAPIVRQALETLQPEAVAVELPTTLADAAAKAVARLPKISVVISEEPGEDALVWVVTPGDPLVEAMRWAVENERQVLSLILI